MPIEFEIRYPSARAISRVRVVRGGLDRLGTFTRSAAGARRVAVVSDTHVAALYGERALASLHRSGLSGELIVVPPGERSKSPRHLARLWQHFSALRLERRDAVVALGGGVVGDLAGFAAASWLRGVPWVGVPTSLLAQADSSIGGKTAIDLRSGKNVVGAFHQPAGVLVDPETLRTLPPRQLRSGLAEVVKTGMAVDASLFGWLEAHADPIARGSPEALGEAVMRTLRAKARVVQSDEREREGGRRTSLNYGHTLAHALETVLGFGRLLHGEAVALGMRVAARLSVEAAGLPVPAQMRQDALLDRLGLPRRMPPVSVASLLLALEQDKKRRRERVRWVLTPQVGHASVPRLISHRLLRAALLEAGARG